MELLEENGEHPQQIRRLGIRDRFVEHGTPAELRAAYGLSVDHVVEEALRITAPGKSLLPSILNGIRSRLERIV
jgi:deoxyxylulose-5-phosphate synthase